MFNSQFSTINAQGREEPQNIEQGISNVEVEREELQRHRGAQGNFIQCIRKKKLILTG
jgi:hypothetical protein